MSSGSEKLGNRACEETEHKGRICVIAGTTVWKTRNPDERTLPRRQKFLALQQIKMESIDSFKQREHNYSITFLRKTNL